MEFIVDQLEAGATIAGGDQWRLEQKLRHLWALCAVRTSAAEGLVILSDTGYSVYGGAPGDNATILRAHRR